MAPRTGSMCIIRIFIHGNHSQRLKGTSFKPLCWEGPSSEDTPTGSYRGVPFPLGVPGPASEVGRMQHTRRRNSTSLLPTLRWVWLLSLAGADVSVSSPGCSLGTASCSATPWGWPPSAKWPSGLLGLRAQGVAPGSSPGLRSCSWPHWAGSGMGAGL